MSDDHLTEYELAAVEIFEAVAAVVATAHPLASSDEVDELAAQLAGTGAYRVVGGVLRPSGGREALGQARSIDRTTVDRIASQYAANETSPSRRTAMQLEGMGIDPQSMFDDGVAPVRLLQQSPNGEQETPAAKTIRELHARGLDIEDLIA
jgi:hypothetical protein